MARNLVRKEKSTGNEIERWSGGPMHAAYKPSSNADGKRLYVSQDQNAFKATGYNKPNTSGKAKADAEMSRSKNNETQRKGAGKNINGILKLSSKQRILKAIKNKK